MKSMKVQTNFARYGESMKREFTDNVCRGCLLVSPTQFTAVSDTILNAFTDISGIKVSKDGQLPNKICKDCSRSIARCLRFKNKCRLSNRILSGLLEASSNNNGYFDLNDLRKERQKHPDYNRQLLDLSNTLIVDCVKEIHSNDLIDLPRTYTNAIERSNAVIDPLAGEENIFNYTFSETIDSNKGINSSLDKIFNELSCNIFVFDSLKKQVDISNVRINNRVSNFTEEHCFKSEDIIKVEYDGVGAHLERFDDGLDGISISSSVKEEILDDFKEARKKKKKKHRKINIKIEKDPEHKSFKRKERKSKLNNAAKKCVENNCDSKIDETVKKDRRIYYRYDEDSVNVLMLSVDEQIRELEEIRMSKQYVEAPFKCESCAKHFSYELSWKGHLVKHEESAGEFACPICRQRFSSLRNLSRHSSGHEKRLECRQCRKVLRATTSMAQHIAKHNGTSHTYICGICDFTSVSNSSHRRHIISHTNDLKRYKCPYCPKAFNHCTTRNDHAIRAHTGQKNFACDVCKMTFVNKTALKSHSITHSERKDFYCVECDKRFKTHSSLANHLNLTSSHGNPAYLKFPCTQCDKRYDSALKLKAHVDCTHLQIFKWACDKCSARFRSLGGIKKHTERYHEGKVMPKIHPCETCGRVFSSKAILRIHFRIHTGERPYVCEICDRPFRQEAAMRTHIKLVHLKLKRPFRSKKNDNTDVGIAANPMELVLLEAAVVQ